MKGWIPPLAAVLLATACAGQQQPQLERRGATPADKILTVDGVISDVQCGSDSALDLTLTIGNRELPMHAADYRHVALKTVDFTPEKPLSICTDLEGTKARVTYQSGADSHAPGRLLGIAVVH